MDDIDFLSDDSTRDDNSHPRIITLVHESDKLCPQFLISSTNEVTNINKINNIFNITKKYIFQNELLSNLVLIVEIIEIREYKGMVFLKIKDDSGSIASVIYKNNYKQKLEFGNKIQIKCSTDLFRGQIQLNIISYQKMGIGDTNSKMELLKKRLHKLGYFDNKPVLENNYTKIGIISSTNAAGMKDFIHTLDQRCNNKKIYIYPSLVQGKDASKELINAINLANSHNITEILVIIRGGGAKEDLECFNSEELAVAIHQSTIPIVTGIGHQIDTSVADLVCAKSFITPTAVAQNITLENINSKKNLEKILSVINSKIINYLDRYHDYLNEQGNKLEKYRNKFLEQTNNDMISYHDKFKQIKKKFLLSIDHLFEYLTISEQDINKIMSEYHNNISNQSNSHKNKLLAGIDIIGKTIKIYYEKYNLITCPQVFDTSNKQITSIKQIKNGQTYKIKFIDGSVNIEME